MYWRYFCLIKLKELFSFKLTTHWEVTFAYKMYIGVVQIKMRYTPVTPLVAATAVREADQNVREDHKL